MTSQQMQEAIKELQETAVVMTHIQARHAELAKDHSEWLAEHTRAIAEIREFGRATDQRIAELVSAIGEFIRRLDRPRS